MRYILIVPLLLMSTIGIFNILPAAMIAHKAKIPWLFFWVSVLCAPYAWFVFGLIFVLKKKYGDITELYVLGFVLSLFYFVLFWFSGGYLLNWSSNAV